MPQEIYHLAPISPFGSVGAGASKEDVNRVIAQLNLVLEAIGTQLGILQARDSQQPTYHAPLNLNGQRVTNVGHAQLDGDAVTLGELAERGMFSRRTGDPHVAQEVIIAAKGIKTATVLAPGFAISFDQFSQEISTITGGDTSFGGTKTFPGTITVSGSLTLSATTPALIVANQNDYNPGSGSAFRLSANAGLNITGVANGSNGRAALFFNIGANAITLQHENAGSAAANRFHFSTGANIVLAVDGAIALWYDSTTTRWRDWSFR